jgi:endonuclease-8
MPEGPSIVILKEQAARFAGQVVREVSGNSKQPLQRMQGLRLLEVCSWGKHFLLPFGDFSLRIHFLLFGSYRIDDPKDGVAPRVRLVFDDGELDLYACSVRFIEQPLDEVYDWSVDVMADAWDPAKARKKLRARPELIAADALLDQDLFAGVGNIIKNEVLFRIRVHPLSPVGALPPAKLRELVAEARAYCFDFLAWKKAFVFKQHWLAHKKTICPRCEIRFTKAHLGRTHRRSFFCEHCQKRYPR